MTGTYTMQTNGCFRFFSCFLQRSAPDFGPYQPLFETIWACKVRIAPNGDRNIRDIPTGMCYFYEINKWKVTLDKDSCRISKELPREHYHNQKRPLNEINIIFNVQTNKVDVVYVETIYANAESHAKMSTIYEKDSVDYKEILASCAEDFGIQINSPSAPAP